MSRVLFRLLASAMENKIIGNVGVFFFCTFFNLKQDIFIIIIIIIIRRKEEDERNYFFYYSCIFLLYYPGMTLDYNND
jgi:hypothetical protein